MGSSLTPEGTEEVILVAAGRADTGHFVSERISWEDEDGHVTSKRPAEARLCTSMTFDDDQSGDAALSPGGVDGWGAGGVGCSVAQNSVARTL